MAPGPGDTFRYGLVAGKKIGGAVERNRVKRRIRHAISSMSPRLGVDIVVIASRQVLTVSFAELVSWLEEALEPRPRPRINQEKAAQ